MDYHDIYQDGYNDWLDGNYENPYDSELEEGEYLWWGNRAN